MNSTSRKTNAVTWGLLASIAGASFALPRNLSIPMGFAAYPPPAEIRLGGLVRDFRDSHADFEVVPVGGFGHFAGMVKTTLNGNNRPVFIPAGAGGIPATDIDIVAHWPMNEGSGPITHDLLGINDGTLTNGPTWVTTPYGRGLHFDGIDDYVAITDSPALRITGDVTISGWFKLDEDFNASSTSQIMMERTFDDDHMFAIVLAGDDYDPQASTVTPGSLVFKLESGTPARYKWTNRTSWVAGQWYHYACVMFGTDAASNQIFIDGVDDTSSTDWGSSPIANMDWAGPYNIGGKSTDQNNLAGERWFKGILDEIMIVNRALTESDLPSGSVGGYRVDAQWRNGAAQAIAPHLSRSGPWAAGGTPEVRVAEQIEILDGAVGAAGADISTNSTNADAITIATDGTIDGDVHVGPGGDPAVVIDNAGTITGGTGALTASNSMSPVVAPNDAVVGSSLGNRTYSDTTTTLTDNQHYADLIIKTNGVMEIDGNLVIRADGQLKVETGGSITVTPGSSLELYVLGDVAIKTTAVVADSANIRLYVVGSPNFKVETAAQFYASVYAPETDILVQTNSTVFGSMVCRNLLVKTGGSIVPVAVDGIGAACLAIDDTMGTAGGPGDGGIYSVTTFNQWFEDVAGVNRSKPLLINLVDDGTGVYEFIEPDFHPIDGLLFGDEGNPHNRHFTYSIVADFTYAACTGQFIEFTGDDSCWIFINGQLAFDLGGVQPGTSQVVEIDRLGLADGGVYEMRFFHAQRHTGSAAFNLRTNIPFSSEAYVPALSLLYD